MITYNLHTTNTIHIDEEDEYRLPILDFKLTKGISRSILDLGTKYYTFDLTLFRRLYSLTINISSKEVMRRFNLSGIIYYMKNQSYIKTSPYESQIIKPKEIVIDINRDEFIVFMSKNMERSKYNVLLKQLDNLK